MFDLMSARNAGERMDQLERFIEFWVGPRKLEFGEPEDALARIGLPGPLARLYRFAGRWKPDGWSKDPRFPPHMFCAQDELIELAKLAPTTEGRLPFISENQNVWTCATDLLQDDPPVWIRENYESHPEWNLSCNSLSKFLISFCLQELLFGSRFTLGGELELETIKPLLDRAEPIWLNGPYALDNDHTFCLMEPDLLVGRFCEEYIVGGNTERAVVFLKSLQSAIRRIHIGSTNDWHLEIAPDGSGSIRRIGRSGSAASFSLRTFDFDLLLPQLLATPGTAQPYGVCHLSFPPGRPRWPVLPSATLRSLFSQALGAAIDKEPNFDAVVRDWPPNA